MPGNSFRRDRNGATLTHTFKTWKNVNGGFPPDVHLEKMKGEKMYKKFFAGAVLLVLMLFMSGTLIAASPVNIDSEGVAIKGYDPVAYFTMDKPVKGKNSIQYEWNGAQWMFSSEAHRNMFMKDPAKYAPRYGGYCAYGVAVDALFDIKPEAWSIVDGSLYLNKNLDVRALWQKDIPGNIEKADMNWPGVLQK
jgi:YHS domain-containing protein